MKTIKTGPALKAANDEVRRLYNQRALWGAEVLRLKAERFKLSDQIIGLEMKIAEGERQMHKVQKALLLSSSDAEAAAARCDSVTQKAEDQILAWVKAGKSEEWIIAQFA